MTVKQLEERGYYLFGIDQNRFVQVRDLKTDKIIVIGQGEQNALERAARYFAETEGEEHG